MKKNKLILFGMLLLASFITFNIAVFLFGSAQVFDVSGSRKYTLNAETLDWLKQNQQNLYFRLYKSQNLSKTNPQLEAYSAYVLKLLEQYQINSHHKLGLQVADVLPFSAQEAEARSLNLKEIRSPERSQAEFLGLVISDAAGNMRTIPYLNPNRQNYLEQDISRIMSSLTNAKRTDVGILSPAFKVIASNDALDTTPNWPVAEVLSRDYNLTYVQTNIGQIPLNIDVLLVINPLELPNTTLYAIDQFLLLGGRVILFLDPLSEYMLANQLKPAQTISQSYLTNFLANLGIHYNPLKVVSDNNSARLVNLDGKMRPYPFWLSVNPNLFTNHPLMNGVKKLNLNSAGMLDIAEVDGIKKTILAKTSANSGEVSAAELAHSNNQQELKSYQLTPRQYPLAVLLEGKFNSYFQTPYLEPINNIPFISITLDDSKLMVVADSDMLLSVNFNKNETPEQDWFDMEPNTGNLDFLINAIDYMSDSSKPISIMPRQDIYSAQSLSLVFYNKAYLAYEPLQMQTLAKIKQTEDALQQISVKLRYNELIPSLKTTQEVENLERQKQTLKKELQEIEYLISERYQQEINLFILQNILLALAFVALIFLVQLGLEKYSRKIAKGYANE